MQIVKDIRSNRAKCLICGDVIESVRLHDHVTCRCGNLSIDGGTVYLKRSFKHRNKWVELSEVNTYENP